MEQEVTPKIPEREQEETKLILETARQILERYKQAFEELAK